MADTNTNAFDQLRQEFGNLSKRNFLLYTLVFFVALVLFIALGIVPQINGIFENRAILESEQKKLQILNSKLTAVQNLASDPDFAYTQTVNNILYDTNPFIEVLYALNQVATNNNITLSQLEYSPGLVATASADFNNRVSRTTASSRNAAAKLSDFFVIFVEATGSYRDLVNFLATMESYAPFNSVSYSDITNNLLGQSHANLEILAQFYNPNTALDVESALPTLNDESKELLLSLRQYTVPTYADLDQIDFINSNRTNLFSLDNVIGNQKPAAEEASPAAK